MTNTSRNLVMRDYAARDPRSVAAYLRGAAFPQPTTAVSQDDHPDYSVLPDLLAMAAALVLVAIGIRLLQSLAAFSGELASPVVPAVRAGNRLLAEEGGRPCR